MKKNIHAPLALLLAAVSVATAALTLQTGSHAQETPQIRVVPGETIEIGTDTLSENPQFSWILTKDRKFQSAQRSRFFQTRLAQPGTYVLDVSIQDPATGSNEYRAFTIIVPDSSEAAPSPVQQQEGPMQALITTDPPSVGGALNIPPSGGLVKIDASKSTGRITTYALDLDANMDTDRDGNPFNDRDTLDTVFEKTGSPIYLYMLPRTTERTLTLSVSNLTEPQPQTTTLRVGFGTSPIPQSQSSVSGIDPSLPPPTPGAIRMEKSGLTVSFSVDINPQVAAGKQLLFTWDFGDRSKSLLTKPSHTYKASGFYQVSLLIRDITTGEVLWNGLDQVEVVGQAATSSVASSDTTATTSSSATSEPSGSGSSGSILSFVKVGFIVLMLLGLAVALYVLIVWIKGKATGRLQDTFEKMEKNIVKKDAKENVGTSAEPMKLKKEAPVTAAKEAVLEKEMGKSDFKTKERTPVTPIASAGPVPSWLAKAPGSAAPAPAPSPKPAPPAAAKPTPAPAPKPTPAPVSAPTENVPDWLKPAAEAKKAAAPVAAPAPTPKPEAPKPAPAPAPAPASKPVAPAAPKVEAKPAAPAASPAPKVETPAPVAAAPATKTEAAPIVAAVPTPKPEAPKPAPAPLVPPGDGPVPDWLKPKTAAAPVAETPKITTAPAAPATPAPAPKVEAPKPATVPAPKAEPVVTVAAPAPVETPKPTPVSVPEKKAETVPEVKPAENPGDEPPIAIIQADSISK